MAEQYDGFLRLKTIIETKDASSQFLKLEGSAKKIQDRIEELNAKKKDLENMKLPTEEFKNAEKALAQTEKQLEKFMNQLSRYKSAEEISSSLDKLINQKKELENMKIPTEDFKKIQKDLDKAEAELKKFTDQINLFKEMGLDTKVITEYNDEFNNAQANVKKLKAEMLKMEKAGKAFNTGDELNPQKYDRLLSQIDKQQAALDAVHAKEQEIRNAQETIRRLREEIEFLKESGRAYESGASRKSNQYNHINNQIQQQEDALQSVYARERELANANEAKIVAGIQGAVDKAISIIKTGITIAGNILRTFATGVMKVFSMAGNAIAERLMGPLRDFAQHGQSGLDIVEKLSKKLWGMVKRVFVFTVITKALRAFRKGLTDANDAWKELDDTSRKTANDIRKAFQGWQDEIVTAFSPLLNMIIPKITDGINQITEATRTFGQLVSGITGSDVYERMARGAEDYDEALGDINKDQKKTQKGLAGFDKLDVLNGGKQGATKEIEKITDDVKDLVDLLKEGKYEEFGAEIARRMEDGLKNIKWGPIKQAATNAGSMLSRIINGVFSQGGLAEQAGRNVAEGINTIASALNGFFRQFKGNEFGKFFSNIFGGLANGIEFKKIRATITTGANEIINVYKGFWENMKRNAITLGKGFGEIISGIFNDINFRNVTQSFKEKIMALSQFITSAIVNIDWDGAARNISDAIDNLINGVVEDADGNLVNVWQKSGQTVGRLIGKVLKTISTVIQNTDFKELGKSIGIWFNNLFAGIDPHDVGAGLGAFIKGVLDMIKSALSQLDGRAIGQAFTELWNGLDVEGIKKSLGGAIIEALSVVLKAIAASPELRNVLGAVLGILGQFIFVKILAIFNPLVALIVGILTQIADLCMSIIDSIFNDIIGTATEILMQVFQPIVDLIKFIIDSIDTISGKTANIPQWSQTQSSAAISGGVQWKPVQTQQQPAQWSSISKNDMKAAFSEALVENADTLSNNGINTVVLDVNGQQLAEATLNDYTNTIQRRGLKADMVFA